MGQVGDGGRAAGEEAGLELEPAAGRGDAESEEA